ncbi:MAG: hypothetical protein P4L86_07680, partial [Mycobacterium sp.]|nr:hypothetical protein [Mycobacterium sp.]
NLEVLASASPTGPFTSSLQVTASETVYYEVVGQLAPVGTVDGSHTITSLTASDGISSLSFTLLSAGSSTLPISFVSSTLATPSTSPSAAYSWSAGTGASNGALQSVSGGTNNEVSNVRPIHVPGAYSAALALDAIDFGSFTVSSGVSAGGTSQVIGMFGGVTSGIRINNGASPIVISSSTESSSNPILGITPLTLTVASQPSWLAPGSAATWNASTKTLSVTGSATIIGDPGSDSPTIVASGVSAQLTIQPATVGFVHLGGIRLTAGASITVPSVGTGRTHTNHNVIVLDSLGGSVPTFSIDGTSKFDLVDNDLIIQNGGSELSTIQVAANAARDVAAGGGAGGTWDGTSGLTSSAAAAAAASNGYEYTTLGIAVNGNLPNGSYATWPAGTSTLTLGANDVIVKYTYNGDFTLDGTVDDNGAGILALDYAPAQSGQDFSGGDMNGDGYVDDTDAGLFALQYGLGTGGTNGNAL